MIRKGRDTAHRTCSGATPAARVNDVDKTYFIAATGLVGAGAAGLFPRERRVAHASPFICRPSRDRGCSEGAWVPMSLVWLWRCIGWGCAEDRGCGRRSIGCWEGTRCIHRAEAVGRGVVEAGGC